MINLDTELINDHFTKFHVRDVPFYGVFHRFTEPDQGDPHDHPFPFTTLILSGGYIERVYTRFSDDTWTSQDIWRRPGDYFCVPADHIHKIITLPHGDCWTYMTPGRHERLWQHWHFDEANFRQATGMKGVDDYMKGNNPMHEYFEARRFQ